MRSLAVKTGALLAMLAACSSGGSDVSTERICAEALPAVQSFDDRLSLAESFEEPHAKFSRARQLSVRGPDDQLTSALTVLAQATAADRHLSLDRATIQGAAREIEWARRTIARTCGGRAP
jgi:hypothetical protein